jgi:predicted PurR-regulated permease PerM
MAPASSDLPALKAPVPIDARTPSRWPPLTYYAKITLVVVAVLGVLVMAYSIRSILLSIFLGLFLAVGFEPLIRVLTRRGVPRPLAVVIMIVGFLILTAVVGYVLLQPAIEQTTALVKALPATVNSAMDQLDRFGIKIDASSIANSAQDLVKELPKILSTSVGSVGAVLGAVGAAVFSVFTVIVLSIYFMLAMPRLRAALAHMLGTRERGLVVEAALQKVGGYVSGQLTLCFLAGVVATVVLSLLHVPYSAVIGLIVALFDAVPQVGAIIAAFVGTLIALSGGWQPAVVTLAVILIYQQIENYVISPRIFSQAVNLSPLAVFVAVLVGGGIGGAVGALVALPVSAATKVVIAYLLRQRRRDRERNSTRSRARQAAQDLAGKGSADSEPAGA